MMHKAWSSIEEVPYCFARSSVQFQGCTALKIVEFDPDWAFPDCNSSLNSPMVTKWCTKLEVAQKRCPIVFSCDQAALQMVFSVCPSVRLSVCLSHLFSCDQAALWMVQSVCPSVRPSVCLSVRPSVCHTFLTMFPSSYHHEIFRSYYQWQKWRPCKRSRSEVKGQGHRGHDPNFRFRTVTPVWIHIWWWNDTYSVMLLRRGALLFFKVIRQISRSHGAKIAEFDPDWAFPDCNSSLNSPMATKWCTKLEVA